jgi:hypothetical protein
MGLSIFVHRKKVSPHRKTAVVSVVALVAALVVPLVVAAPGRRRILSHGIR